MNEKEIKQRIMECQRGAEAARKAGDREGYWQWRRKLLNAQGELLRVQNDQGRRFVSELPY